MCLKVHLSLSTQPIRQYVPLHFHTKHIYGCDVIVAKDVTAECVWSSPLDLHSLTTVS